MRYSILIAFILFSNIIIAQEKSNSGFYKRKEQILEAVKKMSPENKNSFSQFSMELGILYAALSNKDSAFWYLNKALDLCDPLNSYCQEAIYDPNILGFYHFRKYLKTPEWKAFEKRITDNFNIRYKVKEKNLAFTIMKASGADQSVRYCYRNSKDNRVMKDMLAIDSANLILIKQTVAKYGFPGISLVGTAASNAAFLLAQHADDDTSFQRIVLKSMEGLLKKNDIDPENYAYLTDRLMVSNEQKQLYGTQFRNVNGRLQLYPVVDSVNVNKRRKDMGMQTLEEYLKTIQVF